MSDARPSLGSSMAMALEILGTGGAGGAPTLERGRILGDRFGFHFPRSSDSLSKEDCELFTGPYLLHSLRPVFSDALKEMVAKRTADDDSIEQEVSPELVVDAALAGLVSRESAANFLKDADKTIESTIEFLLGFTPPRNSYFTLGSFRIRFILATHVGFIGYAAGAPPWMLLIPLGVIEVLFMTAGFVGKHRQLKERESRLVQIAELRSRSTGFVRALGRLEGLGDTLPEDAPFPSLENEQMRASWIWNRIGPQSGFFEIVKGMEDLPAGARGCEAKYLLVELPAAERTRELRVASMDVPLHLLRIDGEKIVGAGSLLVSPPGCAANEVLLDGKGEVFPTSATTVWDTHPSILADEQGLDAVVAAVGKILGPGVDVGLRKRSR